MADEDTEVGPPTYPDPEETPIKYATRPSLASKGWVTRRRSAAINVVNWKLTEHPMKFVKALESLAPLYGDETAEVLEALAADLRYAYDDDHTP